MGGSASKPPPNGGGGGQNASTKHPEEPKPAAEEPKLAAKEPKPAVEEPKPAPSATAPSVMVFAVLRNGHEGLRGLLKTLAERAELCAAAPSAASAAALGDAWKDFNIMLGYHMAMEDRYVFSLLDTMFDGVSSKEGFGDEHAEDVKLVQTTGAAIEATGAAPLSADTAKAALDAIVAYQAHHEAHLLHEENVMMPLTVKVDPAVIRPAIIHKFLTLDFAATLAAIPLNVREMARRNPYSSFVMLVWAVQRCLTPAQYAQLLPGIREAAGEEKWAQLEKDGCGNPGKFTQADEDALAASGVVM
jgi:hypothetical protein